MIRAGGRDRRPRRRPPAFPGIVPLPGNPAGNNPATTMNPSLDVLSDAELAETTGGNPLILVGVVVGAWTALVKKIEDNPDDYTFLMDWYYESND